ncbi:MAG: adenylate/guanylate cyclase domain-containing protein [Geminicoccaceae bacterium]
MSPTEQETPSARPAPYGAPSAFRILLRTNILAVMLLVVLSVSLALIGFAGYAARRAALVTASALMEESGEKTLGHLRLHLVPPLSVVEVAAAARRVWEPPTEAGHPAERLLLDITTKFPQVYFMFIGYSDGQLFQVWNLGPDDSSLRRVLKAPAAATHAARAVLRPPDGVPREVWRYFGGGDRVIGQRIVEPSTFDARTRPWYAPAMASPRLIRTEPYRFSETGQMGITAAQRFLDGTGGVIGIAVSIDEIDTFLHNQPLVHDKGLMVIFRHDGEIIASSGSLDDDSTRPQLPHLQSLLDPLAEALADPVQKHEFDRTLEIGVHGVPAVARLMPLPLTLGDDTFLGIIVPASQFTRDIDAIVQKSAIVSAIIVGLFVPVMLLASRMIANPLRRLRNEVERIRQFHLEGGVNVRTRLIEVDDLARATAAMKSTLRSFTRYVPRDLVRELIETGTEVDQGGERRELTILFSDIEGFTDVAEDTPPEALMLGLSDYFVALTRALQEEGATIDKFIGDAVMAFWNAPVHREDHAAAACRAALRAARESRRPELWARMGGRQLRTRFGVNTGDVVVGHVGGGDRLSYTAIGAAVNLASRLENLNRFLGTTILVAGATARRAGDGFVFRTAGLVRPKGIARPIRVFELLGEAGDPITLDVHAWDRGMAAYLARDWDTAEAAFATAPPEDALAAHYRAAVARLRADPPGPDWTGVETFATK